MRAPGREHETPSPDAGAATERAGQRFGLALPITMEGAEGETHDISESGILFETDAEPSLGAQVMLTLQYSMNGLQHQHQCEAQVVRVERVGTKFNVAAQLLAPLIAG